MNVRRILLVTAALIGWQIGLVNIGWAYDCSTIGPRAVLQQTKSTFLDNVDYYYNHSSYSLQEGCDVQPGPNSYYFHISDNSSGSNTSIRVEITCSDCGFTSQQVGQWESWDNFLKRLNSSNGSWWNINGTESIAGFHVGSLADFCVQGKRMSSGFAPLNDIDSLQLPLDLCRCGHIFFQDPEHPGMMKQNCQGKGQTDGVTYDSFVVQVGDNTEATHAASLQAARNSGTAVFDEAEHRVREIEQENVDQHQQTKINEKGAVVKKNNGDEIVFVPFKGLDGTPKQISVDFVNAHVAEEPKAVNDGSIFSQSEGANSIQKQLIAATKALMDANSAANNQGNLSLQLSQIGAELEYLNSQIGINDIYYEGLEILQSDLEAIKAQLESDGYNAHGSIIYIGTGNAGGGNNNGGGSQLPTGDAPEIGQGEIGGTEHGPLYEAPSYFGDLEKDCASFECVFAEYQSQYQSSTFVTFLDSFVPPDLGETLPVISGSIFDQPFNFDLNSISGVFDIMKAMVIIFSAYASAMIVIGGRSNG